MINQFEVPMYIEEAIPEITFVESNKGNAYDMMDTLIEFTCKNIKDHDYKTVKRCFKIADKLYSRGNTVVKNAVKNVFVYSFTNMFQTYTVEKQQLLALLPITLYSAYMEQVHHSGC